MFLGKKIKKVFESRPALGFLKQEMKKSIHESSLLWGSLFLCSPLLCLLVSLRITLGFLVRYFFGSFITYLSLLRNLG